nr:SDR family NAD(P)-dependent oxidoreductase [Rhodococcus sp. OK302]
MRETERLVEDPASRCITMEIDTRDSARIRTVVSRSISEFGRLDICIANAGVVSFRKITDLTDAQWATMIDINLTGVFNTLRAAAPPMIEQDFGRIITVASMGGRAGTPNLGDYSAAKWGVIGLTKSLALKMARSGVTANTVCPGTVRQPQSHASALERGVRRYGRRLVPGLRSGPVRLRNDPRN